MGDTAFSADMGLEELSPLDSVKSVTPLDSVDNSYKPDENEQLIATISSGKWDAFVKILDILTKETDSSVIISNSIITHTIHNSILKADISSVFEGDTSISLHIPNPKKWVKLFKQLSHDGNNFIINEDKLFIVTNGEIRLFLPKQLNSVVDELKIPSLENTQTISESKITKEVCDKILNLSKGIEFIEFLIKDNELKAVNVPDTATYIFQEYLDDSEIKNIDGTNADLSLRTSMFLPVNSDEYDMIIGRRNENYFSYTTCNVGIVPVEIYDTLDDSTGGNLFI